MGHVERGEGGAGRGRYAAGGVLALAVVLGTVAAAPPAQAPPPAVEADEAPRTPGPGWTVDATNVGLAPLGLDCASLPEYTGTQHPAPGTVIREQRITGELDLSAGSIVVERSCVQPTPGAVPRGEPALSTASWGTHRATPTKVVVRDSEFDGSLLDGPAEAAYVGPFQGIADLQRNYVHGFGSGLSLFGTGDHLDALVEHNYVTDLVAYGDPGTDGNHSSAFTVRDFDGRPDRRLIVRDNRFDEDTANATGALFVQPYAGEIRNLLVERNLLEGEGFQLILQEYEGRSYTGLRAVDNRMTDTGEGATYASSGPGWEQWVDNAAYDPDAPDGRGIPVPEPEPWE
ncbi:MULTISPECIES: hypothetical protein [unclassified Isoptericola]|uniref:hypothetical protein n=1 Tax=unclassified Isoptericola TaxID=2623355 RepID=UPI00364B8779